jgi:arylsulfatase A-like enzyme
LLDASAVADRKAIFGACFTHESKDLDNPAASVRWRWMVESNWKLILPDAHNEPRGRIELYDLHDDPHELHNLAHEQGHRANTMHEKIDAWWPAKR